MTFTTIGQLAPMNQNRNQTSKTRSGPKENRKKISTPISANLGPWKGGTVLKTTTRGFEKKSTLHLPAEKVKNSYAILGGSRYHEARRV